MTYCCPVPLPKTLPARRPPGRPRADHGPVLDRQELLEAAARQFARGYGACSVRALARELGVSQSAVQHHARTKQDLLQAVVDEVVVPRARAALVRAHDLVREGQDAGPNGLTLLLRDRVSDLATHAGLVSAVLGDRSAGSDGRRRLVLDALRPLREQGSAALWALADQGLSRPLSPVTWMALSLWALPALTQAWPVLTELGLADDRSLEDVLSEVADLLTWGAAARS